MYGSKINFISLRYLFRITNIDNFNKYLKELYKDLSLRSQSNRQHGINFITFHDYYKIPYFLSNKIFDTLDKDKDSFLNYEEFLYFFNTLLLSDYLNTLKLIFDICDFTKKGYVIKEDIKLLLSYLPVNKHTKSLYKIQEELMNETELLVSVIYGDKQKLNLEEFQYSTENVCSHVFLNLLCFMIVSLPIKINNLEFFHLFNENKFNYITPCLNFQLFDKLLNFSSDSIFKTNNILIRLHRAEKDYIQSNLLREDDHDIVKLLNNVNYECNWINETFPLALDSQLKNSIIGETWNNWKQNEEGKRYYEEELFKLTKTGRLKRYIMRVSGKEIFYFKNHLKDVLKGMHNLSGAFISMNENSIIVNSITLFSFKINFCGKDKTFYSQNKDSVEKFVQKLKSELGQRDFEDYYDILNEIGRGSFGIVFKARNKVTKKYVAVKVFYKKNLAPKDLKLINWEIDILKNTHHPNVISFIENMENVDLIYIIMEYASGGDLENFISRKDIISESIACKILKQIANGLKYLHHIGIVHRDLKPGNIFISNLENLDIKIADFGLSKIMSESEGIREGVGSINYVAPEVLLLYPYTSKVDVWSFGIISYYILSKTLPFDDAQEKDEKIATEIILDEANFQGREWSTRSKDSIELIKKCLEKDFHKRYDINNVLENNWFMTA